MFVAAGRHGSLPLQRFRSETAADPLRLAVLETCPRTGNHFPKAIRRGRPLCLPVVMVASLGCRVNREIVREDVLHVADAVSDHTTNSLQNLTYTSSNTANFAW